MVEYVVPIGFPFMSEGPLLGLAVSIDPYTHGGIYVPEVEPLVPPVAAVKAALPSVLEVADVPLRVAPDDVPIGLPFISDGPLLGLGLSIDDATHGGVYINSCRVPNFAFNDSYNSLS